MANAFAELSASGDKIEVTFRYDPDLVRCVKEVPGARYVGRDDGGPMWLVPLNLDVARRLQQEMGPGLVLGRALKAWGKEAVSREANLHALAATDDLPPEELKLNTVMPELTQWMRGYQRADVRFLAATSCLNLNEQRLGKTTEIIGAVFEAGLDEGAHLVVAPRSSLNTVWRFELERWTANIEKPHEVITYSGEHPWDVREHALNEFQACLDEGWPVWFVCTSNTLSETLMSKRQVQSPRLREIRDRLAHMLRDTEWNTFTIDEYHRTGLPNASGKKGTGSQFSDAVKEIKKVKRRYALSGTPMGGKPIKLWGALHFLYPEQFTSKWQWAKTWLYVNSNGYGSDIGGIKGGREDEFYRALAPYVVRRLRREVLPQLPAAQWIDVECEMTPEQDKQYRQFAARAELEIEDKKLNALGILAEYTRLKVFADAYCDRIEDRFVKCDTCDGQGILPNGDTCWRCMGEGRRSVPHPIPSTNSGKLPALLERLEEQGITGDPKEDEGESLAIVASQFKEVANMVSEWLTSKGIKNVKITGDTKDADRTEYQMMFRQDGQRQPGDPRVIVMTTTAGGVAITLDLVENVHILDETWVPDDQEQLADRAVNTSRMHQIGVYVYRSTNTVEQYIQDTNVDKRGINRAILDLRRQGFRADQKAKLETAGDG